VQTASGSGFTLIEGYRGYAWRAATRPTRALLHKHSNHPAAGMSRLKEAAKRTEKRS